MHVAQFSTGIQMARWPFLLTAALVFASSGCSDHADTTHGGSGGGDGASGTGGMQMPAGGSGGAGTGGGGGSLGGRGGHVPNAGMPDASMDGGVDASIDAGGPHVEPPPPPPECEEADGDPACRACTYQGLVDGQQTDATCEYLGMPYAKPPMGERRFMPPEPADAWDGVYDATSFGAACPQEMDLSGTDQKSEDCLFVNVWTPADPPDEPLPVMVFLHGGGYTGGATNTYGGLGLSEAGPVVVVSMNYRLGALGFFAHPELDAERAGRPSGSDGIRDQQLALRWVRNNIQSFHGDPENVTVFGESAGSSSVCVHLVSPGSRHLAQRFILESGVCTKGVANGIAAIPREAAYRTGEAVAADLCAGEADVIDCLRDVPAADLMQWTPPEGETSRELDWTPVVEGEGGVLPESPDALIAQGKHNPGEIIVGTNKNEYGLFALLRGSASSISDMRSRVEEQFGTEHADAIMDLYAPNDSVDANQAYITLMTDVMFRCGSRRFAHTVSAQGNEVYLYSFEQGSAVHADEMTYVFGYEHYTLGPLPPVESLLDVIQGYWTGFAVDGDPNGDGRPMWPSYDADGDRHMTLVDPPAAGSGLQEETCDFWDQYLEDA